MAAPTSKLDHALAAAAKGIPVFRLSPDGKTPLRKGWQDEAATDADKIRNLWSETPDANIGWAMGRGHLAIDVDMKDGRNGESDLFRLSIEHGDLPDTLVNRTPTGGSHILLRAADVANSAHKIAAGLDIRGRGGYVVGAGSTIGNKRYEADGDKIAQAPAWLVTLAGKPRERATVETPLAELDTPDAIARATEWLLKHEPAIQGAAGDEHTYRTAAKLKDLGLSEPATLDLMLEHWNDRCQPPWDPEELERKVANAFQYGKDAQAFNNAGAEFTAANLRTTSGETITARAPHGVTVSQIPRRCFLLGHVFIRQKLTVLVAPPGAGKTTWTLLAALSVASGKPILGFEVKERTKVWYWNNEDETEELDRRLLAAMQLYSLTWEDLKDDQGRPMLFLNSGADRPLKIAKLGGHDGRRILPADTAAIKEEIAAKGVGLFVADPFAELHDCDENDNIQIGAVARMLRQIGRDTDAAIGLIHHTRKAQQGSSEGHAGNADSGRGAGALIGVARVALTLYGMAEKDGKRHGIKEQDRNRYVRLDDAKANLSLIGGKPYWFYRESVLLGGPEGEDVGSLKPVDLIGVDSDMEDFEMSGQGELLAAILRQIIPGEKCIKAPDLVRRLVTADASFAGVSEDALRKRIARMFENGVAVEGMTLRWLGGRGRASNLISILPTNADIGESDANPNSR